jgi:hypothetical protein
VLEKQLNASALSRFPAAKSAHAGWVSTRQNSTPQIEARFVTAAHLLGDSELIIRSADNLLPMAGRCGGALCRANGRSAAAASREMHAAVAKLKALEV